MKKYFESIHGVGLCTMLCAAAALAGPQPQGNATVTVQYPLMAGGTYTASEPRDFHGTNPSYATEFGVNSNMTLFDSVDVFGRRAHVAAIYPEVLPLSESLLTFSFYKIRTGDDYFPGIAENGTVTVTVEGIQFNEPVRFNRDTFLFHNLWDTQQFDTAILRGLFETDTHPHFFHTLTDPFRDADLFRLVPGEFSPTGTIPHEALGDLVPYITLTGDGTDTIGFVAEIPYSLFRHPHEHETHHGGDPYDGLPAPHGFLEPYHFHFEYTVSAVPEPATLALLLSASFVALRRKR